LITLTGYTGWVGFGFGRMMQESDVIIGQGNLNTIGTFTIGNIKDISPCPGGGVCGDLSNISAAVLPNSAGLTYLDTHLNKNISVMRLSRVITTNITHKANISLTGWTNVIFAYGVDSENGISYNGHLPNHRGFLKINFVTGAISIPVDLRFVHGAMMFIAFLVLMPIGAIIARYMKSIGPWWFHLHRIIMLFALLMILIAFILVLVYIKTGSHFLRRTLPPPFGHVHQRYGLAIIILSFIQPFIGLAADKLFDPNRTHTPIFPDILHWIIGWSIIIMAIVQCFLGLAYLYASTVLFGLLGAWTGIIIFVNLGLLIYFILIKGETGYSNYHEMTQS